MEHSDRIHVLKNPGVRVGEPALVASWAFAAAVLSARRAGRLGLAALVVALAMLSGSSAPLAKTPYEAQIGGFMAAALQALIMGEFAGRKPSQVDAAPWRRACRPADYEDLRASATDTAAFDAFHRECKLVETKVDATHVHAVAYLPRGYCKTLKNVFEAVLAEKVYGAPRGASEWLVIEYKGSRYGGSDLTLARGAQLKTACQRDGSLRISAPRVRQRPMNF